MIKIVFTNAYGNMCQTCAIREVFQNQPGFFMVQCRELQAGDWGNAQDETPFTIFRTDDLEVLEEVLNIKKNIRCVSCHNELYVNDEDNRWTYSTGILFPEPDYR